MRCPEENHATCVSFTQPQFRGCPPIPALTQPLPVSFLHTAPPRALLSFSEAFSPPRFGERPPSALGAHRAAPSAAGKISLSGKRRSSSSSGTEGLQRASPPSRACARHCSATEPQGNAHKLHRFRSFLFLVSGRARRGAGTGKAPPLGYHTNTCPKEKEPQKQNVPPAFWLVFLQNKCAFCCV